MSGTIEEMLCTNVVGTKAARHVIEVSNVRILCTVSRALEGCV